MSGKRFKKGDRIVFQTGDGPKTVGTVIGYETVPDHGEVLKVVWSDGQTGFTRHDKDVSPA